MSLFAELQRRKVFKVGAAYLVVGWLLIQVAATVAPQLNLPEWAPRLITFVILLGFPVAILLAWAVDISADGIKHERAPLGNKRMYAIAGALAVLAFVWFYRAELPVVPGAAPALEQNPRLAVLPLANFSPDPANAFFADGLHDDMLTALSRMQGVEVISRTTMQTFKDSKKKLSEIASEVGATQVLEGSVRRDATRVRLTVQLINPRTDGHLWAETYDRPLADALTLQNEVARAVAKAMKVAIASGADDAPPTAVPAAYDLYLKSRLTTVITDQLKLLDSALLLDSKFSLARAARARVACHVFWYEETKRATLLPQARADIVQARTERPGLVAADIAEATCVYYGDLDYPRALALTDRVLAVDANDVDALFVRGNLLRRLDRKEESLAAARQTLTLDPANPNSIGQVVEKYIYYGLFREGIAAIDRVLPLLPADEVERQRVNRALSEFYITGDHAAWLAFIDSMQGKMPQAEWQALYYGNHDPSEASVKYLAAQTENAAISLLLAAVHADQLGDGASRDQLLARRDRLIADQPSNSGLANDIAFDAAAKALRGDRAGAVAAVDAMFALLEAKPDPVQLNSAVRVSVFILARAGEKERALAMLERNLTLSGVVAADLYHDSGLRKLLGTEPRYQAVMKTISDRFEKL